MGRRRRGQSVHGMVLLDKPVGLSSNHALQRVRRLFDARKAGHTGTLDPFATGMLPLCLGEASKTAAFMLNASKVYRATARLGEATDTADCEGAIIETCAVPALDQAKVRTAMAAFIGDIQQTPPMYSALKRDGVPLYKLARQGKTVDRPPRQVTIHNLELLELDAQQLTFEVHCGKGTYVRTLAEDLARALGTCAHLVALRRLSVQPFNASQMVSMEQLELSAENGTLRSHLLAVDAALPDWPIIRLNPVQAEGFKHGNPQTVTAGLPDGSATQIRVYGPDQRLLGLGRCSAEGMLRPKKVFQLEDD